VSLPEDDPDIACLVLVYLYTKDYDLEAPLRAGFLESGTDRAPEQLFSTTIQAMEPEHDDSPSKSSAYAKTSPKARYREGLVHIAVYACADRLGIPTLKTLASQKFMAVANTIDETNFAGLLHAVYEKTAAQDSILRTAATQHSLRLVTKFEAIPRLVEVLKQHEPMVWAMIELFKDELKPVKNTLQATKLKIKGEGEELRHQLGQRMAEFQTLQAFIEGGQKFCMQCGNPLTRVRVICVGDGTVKAQCLVLSCRHENLI
jgi:hypothetical protein